MTYTETGSAETDTAAAIVAGIEIAGPQPIGASNRFHTQLVPIGAKVETIDLEQLEEPLADRPRRKQGTVHVQDAVSFIGYLEKHGLPESEAYADLAKMKLVGVINAGEEAVLDEATPGGAGHRDHRVSLELITTDAWKAWLANDKQKLNQAAFAEFIEDRAIDVVDPDAATMLEIAQSLIASNGVNFKSAHRLADGQVQFQYEETIQARAGEKSDIEIPGSFTISVAPFEGSPPVDIEARFRYRISGGGLTLFYALNNPEDVARRAFLAYVDTVEESITQPLYRGRPE